MNLRPLQEKDYPFMHEWMQDDEIVANFRTDFKHFDKDKILNFIHNSFDDVDKHYAISDENDEYLGTISLKNIDHVNKKAEYAICLRKKAQGKNVAKEATLQLFDIAFNELGLHKVYLNVYEDNIRANKFYQKVGFEYEGKFTDDIFYDGEFKTLNWYSKIKE